MLYFSIQKASPRWDDDFVVGICSDVFGIWPNQIYIGGINSMISRLYFSSQNFVLGAIFGEIGG